MKLKIKSKLITLFIFLPTVILSLTGCSLFSTKVDLNKYITISAEGYNSYGRATYDFDWDAYEEDYSEKIKYKDKKDESDNYNGAFEEALEDCITKLSLDKTSGLTNGDELTLKCEIDEEKAKEKYNVVFDYTEMKYTVSELEEPKEFDPFENIIVAFDGMSGSARAIIDNQGNDSKSNYIYYEVSPQQGLSNGDKVTVSASIDLEWFVEAYGECPSVTSKEYTVDGLKAYIKSASELTDDNLFIIHLQADDAIKSRLRSHDMWYGHDSEVENVEYVGNYFLVPKEGSGQTGNILYMIYHVNYNLLWKKEDPTTDEKYVILKYTNIMNVPDEGVFVNAMDYSLCYETDYKTSFGLETYGYVNFDQIYDELIIDKIDNYTYEKNFTE